ncbi:MAG: hypothetical protein R8P61_26365 [Bacteroidia bacterium]|nr:hypothetical protein [Bacteroidia bacterium]
MGFLRRNGGLNADDHKKLLKASHPGLKTRAGISRKWVLARGPGYLHRFRDVL